MAKIKMVCFVHQVRLEKRQTKYGGLWVCPIVNCEVKCWEGKTSFPGTPEDFAERQKTHKMFDAIWQDEKGPFEAEKAGKRRGKAYKWLSRFLNVEQKHAHIGMLRAAKCREIRKALQELINELESNAPRGG